MILLDKIIIGLLSVISMVVVIAIFYLLCSPYIEAWRWVKDNILYRPLEDKIVAFLIGIALIVIPLLVIRALITCISLFKYIL